MSTEGMKGIVCSGGGVMSGNDMIYLLTAI
jgi:hypothetical protein